MKLIMALAVLTAAGSSYAQAWKTLPKGVRILGYRNVITSKINSNFNQYGSEAAMGAQFRVDASTLNSFAGNVIIPGQDIDANAYRDLVVGEYEVDASAQAQVHGMGFGYGLTDNVMYYAEIAFYNAQVNSNIKRTKGNSYEAVADALSNTNNYNNDAYSEILRRMIDVNERTVQSVITNYYKYKPIGNWQGSGYGDMETGIMAKVIDKGTWGLMLYPGVVLPTGMQDDPDVLQDMGFGDGQFDFFTEAASGYIVNDRLSFGTTLRYTYQAPTTRELRVPTERDFTLSAQSGDFDVKYGDRVNFMVNSTLSVNDWISFTPVYRFMYQASSEYNSKYGVANDYLEYNSDRFEHQVQLTTSLSSIQPFLKKKFALPAQINMNLVQTVAGKNVPKTGRFEIELRMLF